MEDIYFEQGLLEVREGHLQLRLLEVAHVEVPSNGQYYFGIPIVEVQVDWQSQFLTARSKYIIDYLSNIECFFHRLEVYGCLERSFANGVDDSCDEVVLVSLEFRLLFEEFDLEFVKITYSDRIVLSARLEVNLEVAVVSRLAYYVAGSVQLYGRQQFRSQIELDALQSGEHEVDAGTVDKAEVYVESYARQDAKHCRKRRADGKSICVDAYDDLSRRGQSIALLTFEHQFFGLLSRIARTAFSALFGRAEQRRQVKRQSIIEVADKLVYYLGKVDFCFKFRQSNLSYLNIGYINVYAVGIAVYSQYYRVGREENIRAYSDCLVGSQFYNYRAVVVVVLVQSDLDNQRTVKHEVVVERPQQVLSFQARQAEAGEQRYEVVSSFVEGHIDAELQMYVGQHVVEQFRYRVGITVFVAYCVGYVVVKSFDRETDIEVAQR